MVALPITYSLEPRYKEQFATFLASGFSAFIAALKIWPDDAGLAAQVAKDWPADPYVEAYMEKMREDAAAKEKPSTKTAQIKRIEERLGLMSDDNYLKGERLLAEMQGYIEKAAPPTVNVDNRQVVERVMVIRDHGDDAAWEARAKSQQSKLIEHNA